MPLRNTAPLGAPCWLDLYSSDIEKAKRFYGDVFGWEATDAGPDMGNYVTFTRDGVSVAGMMHNDGSTPNKDHWTTYLATADIDATAKATVDNGGTVPMPPMQIADIGWMTVLNDAGGATIAAWQPGTHPGFGVIDEPGA